MKFEESAYDARIAGLFARFQSVQQAGFSPGSYKPGLEGMQALDSTLEHPWRQFRSIHVAGTNGKGSVSSMLASALAAQGFSTGLYTSPHLLDFRERIKIVRDGSFRMIPREEVWEFLEEYGGDFDGRSFFEIGTGMAFWWFARQKVDFAVVEAGLGGRLDSTNIITPVLSVISSIGLDHCAILGSTREEIAAEKAGIFKPGVSAVVSSRDDETAPVFERIAAEKASPLVFASDLAHTPEEETLLSGMDLTGPCQRENLHTCLAALELLPGVARVSGDTSASALPITISEGIKHTAARTGLRGRWERVLTSPETICDIAHNPPALEINFSRLKAICRERPLLIVYGIMADKDLGGIAPLMPSGAEYLLASPRSPRALPAEELRKRLGELRQDLRTGVQESVAAAVESALRWAEDKENPMIYIGGSTFVVAEALESLQKRH